MASIPEQIADTVFALLPVGTSTAFGRLANAENASAQRVVAVPIGSSVIRAPDRIGDAGYVDQGRILAVREFEFEWWCHGEDFEAAEILFITTWLAIRQSFHNSMRTINEEWIDQIDGQDGFVRYGRMIKFRTEIHLPIYEPRAVTGTIVQLTANPKIVTTLTEFDQTEVISQGTP